jgi:hypothetical protein
MDRVRTRPPRHFEEAFSIEVRGDLMTLVGPVRGLLAGGVHADDA